MTFTVRLIVTVSLNQVAEPSPDVLLVRYAPVSRPTATHVPHTVAAKEANSSKRSGLKASGASRPGKLGRRMIAVI